MHAVPKGTIVAKFSLEDLNQRLAERAGASTRDSYTAKLLAQGVEKCAQKLGEEAVEAAIAAVTHNRTELVKESGDVFYHLLVLLMVENIELSEVMAELESRTGQSGLSEKAARGNKN